MKCSIYLKDKILNIIIDIASFLLIALLLFAFRLPTELVIIILVIIIVGDFTKFYTDYKKRNDFYNCLKNNLKNLDQKYLISEIIKKPEFYDGIILYDVIEEIDKSFNNKLKDYETNLTDFKDFVEMWIHEVKIPLSGIYLILHNNKKIDNKLLLQVQELEKQIEQVLYYVRSEDAENDYLIKKVNLKDIIKNVALKNREYILKSDIDFITENNDIQILTDSKWLEFIINQIINNSIKYKKNDTNSYIKINSYKNNNIVTIEIIDNGIGINSSDIKKVFNKSFTGFNGRVVSSSTGMGLYIVKKLCDKLGHIINIESNINEYTKVTLIINNQSIYDILE